MHHVKRTVTTPYGNRVLEEYAFESFQEIVTLSDGRVGKAAVTSSNLRNWLGCETRDEFVKYMHEGWPGLVDQLRSMVDQLPRIDPMQSKNVKRRRKRARGDFGNEVDIHAVRQGRLDAWTKMEHQPKWTHQHKLVHININASLFASTTAQEALWRAAACYRIYEGLTTAGHSVAITMGRLVNGLFRDAYYSDAALLHVPIKSYGQNVTDDQLAIMMSPGFYRHYLIETAGWLCGRKLQNPEGSAMPLYDEHLIPHHLQEEKDNGALVITVDKCLSKREAELLVKRVVAMAQSPKEAA